MDLKKCLKCGKEVPQTEGRRERKFCSEACRQKKWQETQRQLRKAINGGASQTAAATIAQSDDQASLDPKVSLLEAYNSEILQTTYSGDLEKVMKEVNENGTLGAVNKAKLRVIADNHRLSFTN
jgi:endogenous inhibitor of DNA gyrase (YacG/DUF329 family)